MTESYPMYPNFARAHRLAKRSIIRGLKFPDLTTKTFKERPGLVISSVDDSPGYFNSANITLVPLKTNAYNHFDIPMVNVFTYDSEDIGYISTNDQYNMLMTNTNKFASNSCIVCPDVVFDLVMEVKRLQLVATTEAYEEAKELVKEYRLKFMNTYGIKTIEYTLDKNILYQLHMDGSEKYIAVEDENIRRTIKVNEPVCISDIRSVELEIPEKNIDNNDEVIKVNKSRHIRVHDLSDLELITFVELVIDCKTAKELAEKLEVSVMTASNRFNKIMKELHKRGLDSYVIEWPFSRGK